MYDLTINSISNYVANVQIVGLSRALDFRRSFNSQNRSDSNTTFHTQLLSDYNENVVGYTTVETVNLGPRDKKRLSDLVKSGDSHGKSLRMVDVFFDLTLPRRVWVDFDTYRLGKVEGLKPDDIEYFSDSTMHTLTKMDLGPQHFTPGVWPETIERIKKIMADYLSTEDEAVKDALFIKMKDNLPEGFLQTRTVKINYQALRHIHKDRWNHRQLEFRVIAQWIETLPFAKELIIC